jgi:hypothetical protein
MRFSRVERHKIPLAVVVGGKRQTESNLLFCNIPRTDEGLVVTRERGAQVCDSLCKWGEGTRASGKCETRREATAFLGGATLRPGKPIS